MSLNRLNMGTELKKFFVFFVSKLILSLFKAINEIKQERNFVLNILKFNILFMSKQLLYFA